MDPLNTKIRLFSSNTNSDEITTEFPENLLSFYFIAGG